MTNMPVTLFVVDDDDVDVMFIERCVRKHQLVNPVVRAKDGLEALELLRAGEITRPFIVLLDLNMPRMGGLEFLAEIRADEELSDMVVIVLSSSSDIRDVNSCYKKQIAGYFVKHDCGNGYNDLIGLLNRYWQISRFPTK